MRHLAIILAAAIVGWQGSGLAWGQGTRTGDVVAPDATVWLQLAARKSRDEAEALARDFASHLRGVVVRETVTGWHAVAIGPQSARDAEALREILLGAGLVPQDAYLVSADRYLQGGGAASGREASGRIPPRPRTGRATIRAEAAPSEAERLRHGQALVVDDRGGILTVAATVLDCARIETAAGQELRLIIGDGQAGLAYLRIAAPSAEGFHRGEAIPEAGANPGAGAGAFQEAGHDAAGRTMPEAFRTAFTPGVETGILGRAKAEPDAKGEVLVPAYPGRLAPRLGVPVQIVAVGGGQHALRMAWTRADIGAPVLDRAGVVMGIVAPARPDAGEPEEAASGLRLIEPARLRAWLLTVAGVRPAAAIEAAGADRPAAEAAALTVICTPNGT